MIIRILLTLLILTASSLASAAACGKDTGLSCPAPDVDGDGYTTDGTNLGYDCDDSDWQIGPGSWRYSGSLYSQCQANGTWSTGISIPVGATGSGHDYYIDCDAGSMGTGTAVSPFNSLSKVSTVSGGITLVAGDHIWVTGVCDAELSQGGVFYNFYLYGVNGTNSNPIKIKQWPNRAQFKIQSLVNKPYIVLVEASSYIQIFGVEITGSGNYGLSLAGDTQVIGRYLNIHHVSGEITENNAGISFVNPTSQSKITHSKVHNNYDTSIASQGQTQNLRNIVLFEGTGNEVSYNDIYMSDTGSIGGGITLANALYSANIGYKHGDQATTGSSTFIAAGNNIKGTAVGFETGEAGSHFHHNYVEAYDACTYLHNVGGPFYPKNLLVEYNTCKAPIASKIRIVDNDIVPENNIYRKNVYVANAAVYTQEISTVVDSVYQDQTSYDFSSLLFAYDYQENCYFNSGAAALQFSHFADSGAPGGGVYTFTNWQLVDSTGVNHKPAWDDDSFNENPTLDSINNATSSNCSDKGYLANRAGGGSPIPTPTPTASPTATPSSTPTATPTVTGSPTPTPSIPKKADFTRKVYDLIFSW